MTQPTLKLKHIDFPELFHSDGLTRLDSIFLNTLKEKNPNWHDQLLPYRHNTSTLNPIQTSELLISCATILEDFIADMFGIDDELARSQAKTISYNPISAFKKYFVLKRAKKEVNKASAFPPFKELTSWLTTQLEQAPLKTEDKELAVALLGVNYLNEPEKYTEPTEKLAQWCTQALATEEGKRYVKNWVSFKIPERIDYANLVPTLKVPEDSCGREEGPAESLRFRDGFALTDPRMTIKEVQDEVNYCIYCHDHEGDFCSKGFPVKKGDPAQGFKKNPLDLIMTGCPLEEKISEMNFLKQDGHTLGALAMVMVDNPMCPATGHRICNDCMKSCIYQKQEPVNIPQIETRVLTDVLDLPWGVEIYDLLTRWNPLRQKQAITKPYNGLKVMIAGMGPAGFTLAHHLLQEGFAVVGFDGLKIEPLPKQLIHEPIYQFSSLKESLDERIMSGFGGVAEYGITVRWDKNFLKLIYLTLMRRPYFQVFGGVRFGGTITIDDAWELGFDHFVVAVGAGLPKALPIPNSLAPGMRPANDFLMALQLGNAAKSSSLTNLQIRLPAVVIGGGLTGVDTATELQAYYISQVEKTLTRYEILSKEINIDGELDAASRDILNEYLQHGRAVRTEREKAKKENRQPDFIKLIREWGGVSIAYRRSMQESPAYINNHEELKKALEEGIYYIEALEPTAVELNEHGYSDVLICHKRVRNQDNEWVTTTEEVRLPARSILAATGTQPNTAYEFEHRGTFNRVNLQYQHYEEEENGELIVAHGVEQCKDPNFGPFTSYHRHDKRVSLIGDTHPVFHGNVVKAIASGLRTYPKILDILKDKLQNKGSHTEYQQFANEMRHLFTATVVNLSRKTDSVIEITIKAPVAAKHFKPGQFYRLQNLETLAPRVDHTLFQMEPLALTTANCDKQHGLLTFIVHETTATAKICATLKPGEVVSLMGPTGVRSRIPSEHETVLIVGNQASFPFMRSYGSAVRTAGNQMIYLGQFEKAEDVFCQDELEQAADVIIWQTKTGEPIKTRRSQDVSLSGDDILAALKQFAETNKQTIENVDRAFIVGNSDMLRRFQTARKTLIKDYLIKDPDIYASVYGNMQCMLKGVCAQCLQWQIDPETGQRTKAVFACSWQDQPLEIIDIHHMDQRQMQNRLLERLSKMWVDYLFKQYRIESV